MAFFVGMMIQYILLSWLPSLLVANGLSHEQASLAQLSYNLLSAPGSILAGFLIAHGSPSRRVPWIFASAIGALVLIATGPVSLAFSMVAAGLVGLTVSGSMATVFAFAPGIYPAHARGTGVGFALAVGRVGAIISPLLVSAMIGTGANSAEVLGVMAPLMLMGGFGVWQIARSYPQEQDSVQPIPDRTFKTAVGQG
jgi:MFS transporter, AAHS family, 3-hydroxyphenylpropionic acid transporter